MNQKATLEKIVALCKHRGFIFPSGEIYGGLNGVYDTGPLGYLLKENIKRAWRVYNDAQYDGILCMDGAILGSHALWEASGHVSNFHDPMIDCLNCKHRFRTDEIGEDKKCPNCGAQSWTDVRQFNMMFSTQLGASSDQASVAYLRPETAQTIFVNFKNIMTSYRMKLPFGIAQIGKAFRNEITPKQFLFRMREFEQMELEWFCLPKDAEYFFDLWRTKRFEFYRTLGVQHSRMRVRNHEKNELSHYSTATSDIEYHFPFGWKELEGIAYRGNFDLSQHSIHSKKDLAYYDETEKQAYMPHVVESSVGVDRLFLTLLFDAYDEEELKKKEGGAPEQKTTDSDDETSETRVVLRLHPSIAPIKAAILPLTKKQEPLARALYQKIKKETGVPLVFDLAGSIGKRYRRYDEIGVPYCITWDFNSEANGQVTIRDRDSMQQELVPLDKVIAYLQEKIAYRP